MSSSFWTGNWHPLGKRKAHTSSRRLPGQCRTFPSLLHAMFWSWNTSVPAGWSHFCDNTRPRRPAASTGAVSAGASPAAPGPPEMSLAAGICPQGQSSAAPFLAGEQGHALLAAHPASRQ